MGLQTEHYGSFEIFEAMTCSNVQRMSSAQKQEAQTS